MTGRGNIRKCLRNADVKQKIFLTLAIFLTLVSHFSHADTPVRGPSEDDKHRISEVETYLRQQTLRSASLLPQEARTALGWVSGNWHHVSLTDSAETDSANDSQGVAITEDDTQSPVSFVSNFHHKGFLPLHDAMMLGIGWQQDTLNHKLEFSVKPFYGQGWRSLQGYWGAEATMNVVKRTDGLPWGQLSVGYIGGNEAMSDHGRGIDLHGDVDLTNNWKLTTGVRQNTITGDTNYALIRWKLSFP